MNENFGFIDIILLAFIAGLIILRLRNSLGKGAEDSALRAKNIQPVNVDAVEKINKDVVISTEANQFNETGFLKGAQAAYEMIVNAFANGDKKILKELTDPEIYKNFISVIDDRQLKKIKNEFTFIGIKKAKIEEIKNQETLYQVKVRFISEIISSTKDEVGKIINGNNNEIQTVNDVWVFRKDLNSDDPTWYLTEISQTLDEKDPKK
jgi:predicted lipid-binding transport protein (Tim44 family)